MGIALWGARGRCCALRVGSKEFRWWATLLGVCLVGTGPTCAGLPPPAPTSPTADPFRPLHFPCSFSAPKAAPYSGARVCPCWGGGFASWSRAWRGGFSQASRRVVSRHRALREIVFGRCGAAAAAAPDCCPLKVPLLPSPQPSCFPFYLIGVHSTMTPRSPHRRFFRVPIRAIGTGARGSGLPRAFFSLSPAAASRRRQPGTNTPAVGFFCLRRGARNPWVWQAPAQGDRPAAAQAVHAPPAQLSAVRAAPQHLLPPHPPPPSFRPTLGSHRHSCLEICPSLNISGRGAMAQRQRV